MRTPSIRRRVTVAGVMVVFVVMVIVGVFTYVNMQRQLDMSLRDVLDTRMAITVQVVEEFDGDLDAVTSRLQQLAIPAIVHHPDGRAVRVVPPSLPQTDAPPVPPRANLIEGPRISAAVEAAGGGRIEVFASERGVDRTMYRLMVLLVIGTLTAVALAAVFLRRSTDYVLRPLDEVGATARRIADGAVGERLRPDEPHTELGKVAEAFDEMVDSLEAAVAASRAGEERVRRFLSDAAHQLRTPLAGVRASVELLLRSQDDDERERLLGRLLRETGRMTHLVGGLLRIARLDLGAEAIVRRPADLVEMCRREVERARELAEVEIALDAPADMPPVAVDGHEVQEALANLLDNARRHARTRIRVAIADLEGHVEIRVADDGAGVPEPERKRIFDRFATLDARDGSGLGLPIARAIARAHGGDVTYDGHAFVLALRRG